MLEMLIITEIAAESLTNGTFTLQEIETIIKDNIDEVVTDEKDNLNITTVTVDTTIIPIILTVRLDQEWNEQLANPFSSALSDLCTAFTAKMDEHVGTEHSGYVNYECTSAANGSIVLDGIVNTDLTVSVLQDLNDIAFALRLIVLTHATELGLVQGSNNVAVLLGTAPVTTTTAAPLGTTTQTPVTTPSTAAPAGCEWDCALLGYQNTMCLYTGINYGQCGQFVNHGLTDDEKDTILNIHNTLRNLVASGVEADKGLPPSGNMRNLVWDDCLSEIAQRWADQCYYYHDEDRRTSQFNFVGQNLDEELTYYISQNKPWSAVVEKWFSGIQTFYGSGGDVRYYMPPQSYGSYQDFTQLIWAGTTHVGCGRTKFYRNGVYATVFVCNYGPGGNIYGRPIY